ncbi:hypothetical protein OH77DRAFT_1418541 [Trametes cingulata]|nr:hypothetical protein OH77DRAFT_1418541 [Trametes cingulata]
MSGLGYFAFPPPGAERLNKPHSDEVDASDSPQQPQQTPQDAAAEAQRRAEAQAREEQRKLDAADFQRRVEMDRELALQGEMEYVRMGFSIRDRYGRVDRARTDVIRAEIRRRDEQARLIKQWESYGSRWQALLASDYPISFADIPWPMSTPPSSVHDLSSEAVVQFFLDSLRIPNNAASETNRFRRAVLRWHPDKMGPILARTVDADYDSVREGVNVVFRALHAHLNRGKDNEPPSA